MERDKLIFGIISEEGFKSSAYTDTKGFLTIGHGICIDSRRGCGITLEESKYLLGNRLNAILTKMDTKLPWWRDLPEGCQEALCQMAYQMGFDGLLGFRKMLEALQFGRYEDAAAEALDSDWAREDSPARAYRIAALIRGK